MVFFALHDRLQHSLYSLTVIGYDAWAVACGGANKNIQTVADSHYKIVSAELSVKFELDFKMAKNVTFKVEKYSTLVVARFKKLILKRSDVIAMIDRTD